MDGRKTKRRWKTRKPKKSKSSQGVGSISVKTTRSKKFKNTYGGLGVAGNPASEFTSLITKTVNPFPSKWTINLTYGINDVIVNLGSDNKWRGVQYRLTNIFDPEVSNLGRDGQPYGFDQISPFFKRYVVTTAKYDVVFNCPGTNNQTLVPGCFACVAVRNESDYAGYMIGKSLQYPLEREGNTVKPIRHDTYEARFKGTIIPMKILGSTSWDNYLETSSAEVTGGPSVGDNVFVEFDVCEPSSYTYDKYTRLVGTITYTVMFYDPIGAPQS